MPKSSFPRVMCPICNKRIKTRRVPNGDGSVVTLWEHGHNTFGHFQRCPGTFQIIDISLIPEFKETKNAETEN